MPADELGPPTRIYTDGSYCRMGGGWAYTVVAPSGYCLTYNRGIGAFPSSASAELRAILEGLRAAMTIGHRNVEVCCDSSEAIAIINGTAKSQLHITEQRQVMLIRCAIEACKRVEFVLIGGRAKWKEPHRRWHKTVDKAARDGARGMSRNNLKQLATGEVAMTEKISRKYVRVP